MERVEHSAKEHKQDDLINVAKSDMTFMISHFIMKEDIRVGNSILSSLFTKQVISVSYCLEFKVVSFFIQSSFPSRSIIIVLRQSLNILCRQGATGLSVTPNTKSLPEH